MAAAPDADAAATGDPLFFAGGDSACSTPFVSAPSSPSRDRDYLHAACFYSAPASPTRGGGLLDFDFDFSSRFPSPSAAAMSSADELFCNGQIRPVRLAAALLHPQPPLAGNSDAPGAAAEDVDGGGGMDASADERGRVRGRSVRRKARSMSPFRTHWRRSPAPPAPQTPAPETESGDEPAVTPAASRSSSSSSTASSASSASSSSSSRSGGSRRWGGFLKDLLHRSKSDGGKTHHHQSSLPATPTSPSPGAAPKRSPSPAQRSSGGAAGQRGGRRRSAHERLYEARRAEAEEMRRRTYLPYRQGFLLFGCIGLGNRSSGYGGAVHGLARGLNAAAAVSSRS
ncbi:unnamed protein product [Urochloa humidicola]